MKEWIEAGKKLKAMKTEEKRKNATYEETYPERIKLRQYYRDHPEELTMQKKTELIIDWGKFAMNRLRDAM